jgi:hypothetical protein
VSREIRSRTTSIPDRFQSSGTISARPCGRGIAGNAGVVIRIVAAVVRPIVGAVIRPIVGAVVRPIVGAVAASWVVGAVVQFMSAKVVPFGWNQLASR